MPGRCPWRKVQSDWRDKTSKQTEVKLTKFDSPGGRLVLYPPPSPPPLGRGHAGSQITHPSPPQRRDTLARSHTGSRIAHHLHPPGRYHSGSQSPGFQRRDTLARSQTSKKALRVLFTGQHNALSRGHTESQKAQATRDVIRLRAVRRQRRPSESSSRGKLKFPLEGCVESRFQIQRREYLMNQKCQPAVVLCQEERTVNITDALQIDCCLTQAIYEYPCKHQQYDQGKRWED
ncbi:hypothetical protein ACN38_g11914 [Penicillium nordicum]|uniref:Uncharacterized protein n=1 Tax=Penicillium nordicum TaxID=229535 RepID=A0A0M8NRL3_9EURO|nr:hypothetical protein ACN38_g11914 [Penicillium nordicum]